jgi:hypothetical protein
MLSHGELTRERKWPELAALSAITLLSGLQVVRAKAAAYDTSHDAVAHPASTLPDALGGIVPGPIDSLNLREQTYPPCH